MGDKTRSGADAVRQYGVLIVDDHPIVRQGLAQLINEEPDLHVCGQAEDAVDAIQLIGKLDPALVIVDLWLKNTSGLELIKDIKVRFSSLPVLTLSMHDEAIYAERALRAGARGYIMKHEATDRVVTAIRRVLAGQIYVSEDLAANMVGKLLVTGNGDRSKLSVERLSDRELEVFRLIGMGYGTREMATGLHLSQKTIETYRAHIKEKLHLLDTNELLRTAIHWVKSNP
jgi:DNA-binding NarL/FixJ family response regulator